MLFNSLDFIIFFIIVSSLVTVAKSNDVLVKCILLVASAFFYAYWNWYYLALIYFTVCYDYFLGKKIFDSKHPQLYLTISIGLNLLVLFFFKYVDFLINSINYLSASFSWELYFNSFDWVLPVGISFYTFQSMSYSIDIYRQKIKPRNSIFDYALYISFFPQLVAGPIIRAKKFFSQLDSGFDVNEDKTRLALFIVLIGFVQKVVFADGLAQSVDPVFSSPESYGGFETLMAVYGYGFQIYFDFAGYTNIAIGIALSFGFQFPTNFNFPYISTSFKEFWQRWHISLSTWLRDYLYISLGGNRFGFIFTLRNLMLTMLIGGLWHGASWNFVIWGGLHGLYLIIEKITNKYIKANILPKPFKWFLVFNAVCFAWIFFRASSFSDSQIIISNLLNVFSDEYVTLWSGYSMLIFCLPVIHYLFSKIDLTVRFNKMGVTEVVVWQSLMALMLIYFGVQQSESFIYFQF